MSFLDSSVRENLSISLKEKIAFQIKKIHEIDKIFTHKTFEKETVSQETNEYIGFIEEFLSKSLIDQIKNDCINLINTEIKSFKEWVKNNNEMDVKILDSVINTKGKIINEIITNKIMTNRLNLMKIILNSLVLISKKYYCYDETENLNSLELKNNNFKYFIRKNDEITQLKEESCNGKTITSVHNFSFYHFKSDESNIKSNEEIIKREQKKKIDEEKMTDSISEELSILKKVLYQKDLLINDMKINIVQRESILNLINNTDRTEMRDLEKEFQDLRNAYKNLEKDYTKILFEKEELIQKRPDIIKETKPFKIKIKELTVKYTENLNELAKYKIELNIIKSDRKSLKQGILNLFNHIIDSSLSNPFIKLGFQKDENESEFIEEICNNKDESRASIQDNKYHLTKLENYDYTCILNEICKIFDIYCEKLLELKSVKSEKKLNSLNEHSTTNDRSISFILEEMITVLYTMNEKYQTTIADEIIINAPSLLKKNNCRLLDLLNIYFEEVKRLLGYYEIAISNNIQANPKLKLSKENINNQEMSQKHNPSISPENYIIYFTKEVYGVRWCLLISSEIYYDSNDYKPILPYQMIWVKSTDIKEEKFARINNIKGSIQNKLDIQLDDELNELKKENIILNKTVNHYIGQSEKYFYELKECNSIIEKLKNERSINEHFLDHKDNFMEYRSKSMKKEDHKHFIQNGIVKENTVEKITSFCLNERNLLGGSSYQEKMNSFVNVENQMLEDINNLRLELNRVIISRDNFKTIYDQCIKTKESQRLEFITLMSINIESLLIQLPTPIK